MVGPKTRDRFQVAAFHAFYKAARISGLDRLNAFVSGIVKSSDEETDRILANDPNAIQRWLDFIPPRTNKTQTERENYENC